MNRSNRQRIFLIVVLVALFAVLLVLIGSINGLHPLPGKRLPNPFANLGEQTSVSEPASPNRGARAVVYLIQSLLILGAAIILFYLIISRRFRIQLVITLILFSIAAFAISHINISERPETAQESSSMGLGSPVSNDDVRPEVPPPSAANWLVVLIAAVSSIVIAGLALLFYLNIYPALRRRRAMRETILNELGKQAGQAMQQIIDGDDPRAAILRCYQEMSAIVSRAERTPNFSYFTPREFASHLRSRGMKDEHVDRLTAIFETVRYGGRSGMGFVDEAVACLESIQLTYAHEGRI